jgi:hypothetical protein
MNVDLRREPTTSAPVFPSLVPVESVDYAEAVECIVADCFLSVGQAIGLRASLDFEAVRWLHDHFRQKFLSALLRQGNRWLEDRAVVTAVAGLFAERALRHAGDGNPVGLEAVRQAAADVERYCKAHAQRRAASRQSEGATALIAGYWCVENPEP